MRSDALTKLLLALIALGVFLMLALDLRWIAPATEPEASPRGRYRLMAIGMARELVMLDTHTGQAWRASFRGTRWQPMKPLRRPETEEADSEDAPEPEPESAAAEEGQP